MDFNAALAFIVKVPVARRWNDRTAQLLRRHVRKNKLSYEIARGIVEQLETKEYWIIQAVTVANDVTIVFSRWTVQAERPCVTPSARPLLPQSPMKISTFRKYTLTQSTKKWRKYRWKKKKIYSDSRCVTNSWEFVRRHAPQPTIFANQITPRWTIFLRRVYLRVRYTCAVMRALQ